MGERLRTVGWILAIGGAVCFAIPLFFDTPPKLSTLSTSTLTLSGKACIHRAPKTEAIGLLPFGEFSLRLPTICNLSGCKLPTKIAELQPGHIVTVWRDGIIIWQLTKDNDVIYSYADALRASSENRLRQYVTYSCITVAGALLIAFNRSRNA